MPEDNEVLTADEAAALLRAASVSGEDLSDLLFTSGTTGKPKGVMSAHGQTIRAFGEYAKVIGLQAGDRYLVINPFFHAFGYKAGWLTCLLAGEPADRDLGSRLTAPPAPARSD